MSTGRFVFSCVCALACAVTVLAGSIGISSANSSSDATGTGVGISYRLPATGPLPQTYRVTLAITAADDPNWIISEFLAGAPRTVTAENHGQFTETWDGLDDNFMPVPPGSYKVRGIFMPARRWPITGDVHTLVPKLAVAAGDSWFPPPRIASEPNWLWGAGFGTMADVAIGPSGEAIFRHGYIENSFDAYRVDLKKPIGYDQVLKAYGSWGTAGGAAVATDGEIVWEATTEDAGDIVFRADGQPFGHDHGRYRDHVFALAGRVSGLAAWRNPKTGARFLYVASRDASNGLFVLDGQTGIVLKETQIRNVQAVTVQHGALFLLHQDGQGHWAVDRAPLRDGLPSDERQPWSTLAEIANATDLKIGSRGHAFVSDLPGNQVYEVDRNGRILRRFGRATAQQPGHYDHHVFMSPGKLALWVDPTGKERLIVVERSGPGRVSEWRTDGTLLREWFPGQVQAVFGYAIDPDDPEHVYMTSASGGGLIRFRVNYQTGDWAVDAVWPDVALTKGCPGGSAYPKIINTGGRKYLAFAHTRQSSANCDYMLYRLDGERWVPSAGLVLGPTPQVNGKPREAFWWNDANGDGKVEEAEYLGRPANLPTDLNYWGDTWLDDLSLVMLEPGGRRAWRLAPSGFDAHGNPIFQSARWTELLTDPVVESLRAERRDLRHGGNELPPGSGNNWMGIDGRPETGFVVAATTGETWPNGIDSTGRIGTQVKVSRYLPDGRGGYRMVWRVGRKAFGLARPGEIYGALHVSGPINGLFAVQDGNGLMHVFTDDGLYVDTLFYDVFRGKREDGGVYALGGELFDGYAFLNRRNSKVYFAMGRNAATLFEISGWKRTGTTVRPISDLPAEVQLTAGDVASVPPFALRIRTGRTEQSVIEFQPAPGGGPALDGSPHGWESAVPVDFGLDENRKVDIRAMYDSDTLYLRGHVRLSRSLQAGDPGALDHIFTDTAGTDTWSFYVQGDPTAPVAGSEPRLGDVRFVFALINNHAGLEPIVLGMYPVWNGSEPGHPLTYSSPVGTVSFGHVGRIQGARRGHAVDPDERGFTIAAAIPRSAIPSLPSLDGGGSVHTTVDFEATLGGKTKFWWSNADGSASTMTSDVPSEARLYHGAWGHAQFAPLGDTLSIRTWLIAGPWGGPGLPALSEPADGEAMIRYKLDLIRFFETAHYPPDNRQVVPGKIYEGALTLDEARASHSISWRIARSGEEDDLARLGNPGQLYFATIWIRSPDERNVTAEFLFNPQNLINGWIDGREIAHQLVGSSPLQFKVPLAQQAIRLHPGWNQLFLRSYAVGYSLALGVRLHDTRERLWQLQLAASPP